MESRYIDLQVNGNGGADFTTSRMTEEDVVGVAERLAARGVAAFLPTVVTTDEATYRHVLPILANVVARGDIPTVVGVHVEGPMLNPAEGARGAHRAELMQQPSIDLFERLRDWADDTIAVLTVAPELPGASELIEHVRTNTRTIVSIGHCLPEPQDVRAAASAGAELATHVGNGLPDLIHRHKNPLWPILEEPRLTAMLITDGHHIPDDMIRVVLRAKGPKDVIVTSDQAPIGGLPPGEYEFHGNVVVLEEDGYLHRKGEYAMAGSSADMKDCMDYLSGLGELDNEDLKRVGSENARRLLAEHGLIRSTARSFPFDPYSP